MVKHKIRLSRACGLKHPYALEGQLEGWDQALASLRIETLINASEEQKAYDQALASLRIETYRGGYCYLVKGDQALASLRIETHQ